MSLRDLDYQSRVLTRLDDYLSELSSQKKRADGIARLAAEHLGRHKGFVLWIVPNEAIYAQTRRQLIDRLHPYRQMLDVLSGNAVRILEKDDHLDAREVESHLCVMLLMLQSSNRENKDSLKMFRDRGDVYGFFPPEGDQEAHAEARKQTLNLDIYDLAGTAYPWPQIKDSLGNALRLIRPVVVMDEGHKAVSDLAFATLYGFNPCFVLELTATPKDVAANAGKNPKAARYSNVLVEVKGIDLDREGMIKMPLNLDPREGADWRHTLAAALNRLRGLDDAARQLHANTGRTIRPILLVQVERTGIDQRDGTHVHALDAKEWLTTVGGLDNAEVAAGRIQFRLRADGRNWRMPFEAETYQPLGADQLIGNDGEPLGKSLFSPLYKGDFSSQDEREIAVYLDGDNALKWWHRNVARSHYSVQGWRREKIYPDFIFAVHHGDEGEGGGKGGNKLVVLEMKGKHLAGNDDTNYKQAVLRLMTNTFSIEKAPRVGELELVVEDGTSVECDLVLMPDWKTKLPSFCELSKPCRPA